MEEVPNKQGYFTHPDGRVMFRGGDVPSHDAGLRHLPYGTGNEELVKFAQAKLNVLGANLTVDGVWGKDTVDAAANLSVKTLSLPERDADVLTADLLAALSQAEPKPTGQ